MYLDLKMQHYERETAINIYYSQKVNQNFNCHMDYFDKNKMT